MKKKIIILSAIGLFFNCKEEAKISVNDPIEVEEILKESVEERVDITNEIIETPKTAKQIKEELTAKGYKIFYDIDPVKQDTFLMQQYYMAFLKKGPIRGQNEEETADLQEQHLAHLTKMYELGYADISGPFGDDGDIRGITIYNVPTLKIADSLANSDPMVKAGRLQIEMHPWWAAKGFPLR